MRKERK
jgi:hypothetical protein